MLKSKKKALALAVLCAVSSIGVMSYASAEEAAEPDSTAQNVSVQAENNDERPETHRLKGITVEGDKDVLPGGMVNTKAKLGILGDKSIMDIPYSEMSMTAKQLETFDDPSQPLQNVLLNNPSIRLASSSPMYTDFSMRGINMNGNHMMLNGIPSLFYQFTTPPTHVIDRIDITSGPNAGVNGVSMSNNGVNSGATPAPGTINIITKRATDEPITRYTQTFSGRGNMGEFIDVGRRFGKNGEWGLRVNAEYMDGELSLPGAEKEEKNIFINLDHRGEKSTTNLFAGHFDLRVNGGQRWFSFNPSSSYKGGSLPGAPDSDNNYDFDGTTKYVHGYLMTLNHEQKMDDNWAWFANFGQSRRGGNKDNQGSSLRFDENGNFVNNSFSQQNEEGKNVYAQIGIKGQVETGEVMHNLSLAVDRSWAKYWTNGSSNTFGNSIVGDFDDWYFNTFPHGNGGRALCNWEETNVGVTIADTLEYKKLSLLLAASRKHENIWLRGVSRGEYTGKAQQINNDNVLPTYGITYKPVDNVALYAGHTESFSRGYMVGSGYTNSDEVMEPVKSKQNEIGVKYENAGVLTTLSYFDIDEANRYNRMNSDGSKTYVDDGKNSYQGLELTVNGKIADKWTATGGLMYIDAEREKTAGGTKDGYYVNGVAKWSGVLGLVYEPDENWDIIGRAVWSDNAYVEAKDHKVEIPSYATFDLGVSYKTKINSVPVKLTAMCYNLTDKDYWYGRGNSTTIGLSMPRTFMLSAQFDI